MKLIKIIALPFVYVWFLILALFFCAKYAYDYLFYEI